MLKLICLFSDGTGNSSSSPFKTNVFRLYDALDRSADAGQIAYYDDGVGSSQHRILALIGGAFGFGLKRNVLDLYKFLARHYGDALASLRDPVTGKIPEDRIGEIPKIACFGFSRGAFTIRVLIGLVNSEGLPIHAGSESELDRLARRAYNEFRRKHFETVLKVEKPFRWLRDKIYGLFDRRQNGAAFAERFEHDVKIDFLGLWDTVGAYGLPVEELRIAIDKFIFPLTFTSYDICDKVVCVRHALSIDDERDAFTPIPFDDYPDRLKARAERQKIVDEHVAKGVPLEEAENTAHRQVQERSQQIWFAGVHANVGGGYPDDSEAILPMRWIMREAMAHHVVFREGVVADIEKKATAFGQLYDSRAGLAALYRYKPRDPTAILNSARVKTVAQLVKDGRAAPQTTPDEKIWPLIHESVIFRMAARFEGYAPIALPAQFCVVDDGGRVRKLVNFVQDAQTRTGRFANGARAKLSGIAELVEKISRPDAAAMELVANAVFWRRVSYQVTLWSLIALLIMPVFDIGETEDHGFLGDAFIWLVDLVAKFTPGFLSPWFDAFRTYPLWAGAFALLFVASFLWGGYLKRAIVNRAHVAWGMSTNSEQKWLGRHLWDPLAKALRGSRLANRLWDLLSNGVAPVLFVFALLFVGVTAIDRVVFQIQSVSGLVCQNSENVRLVSGPETFIFKTSDPCAASGLELEKGRSYLLRFAVTGKWRDGDIDANLGGWERSKLSVPDKIAFAFLGIGVKRVLSERWFQPILQVGTRGLDIVAAKPVVPFPANAPKTQMDVRFKASRKGELFVYVNDAYTGFLPIGFLNGGSCATGQSLRNRYGDNCGAAEITVTPLPEEYGD